MTPVIKWTLWQRRWAIMWWSIGIVFTIVLTIGLYPSIRDQAEQLNQSFAGLSDSASALFGGTDFFSPVGYLNSQLIYFTLPLLLAILGIGLGTSVIGREEADSTIESLLARPVSRTQLLISKAGAALLIISFVTLLGTLTTLITARLVNFGIPLGYIAIACLDCLLLSLTFAGVAFLLSATGRGRAAAIGIATVYAFGGYLIGSLSGTVTWLHKPSLVFPYHYFNTASILRGDISWKPMIFYALFTLACGILAWLSFRRRDLE